jgi:hypothetical protein
VISWVLAFESPDGLLKIGAMSWSEHSRKKQQAELEQLASLTLLDALSKAQEYHISAQDLTARARHAILQSRRLIAEARQLREARKHSLALHSSTSPRISP